MVRFLLRAAVAAIGLWVASVWVSGLTLDTPGTLLLAGLLLGIVNAIVRPIAILLTFPVTIVTLGLFLLVINAAMLGLVAGMHVAGFWAAFAASFIVSVVSFIGSRLIGPSARVEVIVRRR